MISRTRAPTGPEVTISLSRGASRRPQSDWLLGSGYCTGVDFKDSQGAQGSAGLLIQCRRHRQALALPALMCGCCSLLWAVGCLSMLVAPCSCSGHSGSVQLRGHLVRSLLMPALGQVKVGNQDDWVMALPSRGLGSWVKDRNEENSRVRQQMLRQPLGPRIGHWVHLWFQGRLRRATWAESQSS